MNPRRRLAWKMKARAANAQVAAAAEVEDDTVDIVKEAKKEVAVETAKVAPTKKTTKAKKTSRMSKKTK